MSKQKRGKVIAYASAKGGVGKTTLAVEKFLRLVKSRKDTIIIDFDVGKPFLHIIFRQGGVQYKYPGSLNYYLMCVSATSPISLLKSYLEREYQEHLNRGINIWDLDFHYITAVEDYWTGKLEARELLLNLIIKNVIGLYIPRRHVSSVDLLLPHPEVNLIPSIVEGLSFEAEVKKDYIFASPLVRPAFIIQSLNYGRNNMFVSRVVVNEMFDILRELYDFIIIDAPSGITSWGFNTLACVDQVNLVTMDSHHPEHIDFSMKLRELAQFNLCTVVNKFREYELDKLDQIIDLIRGHDSNIINHI